MLVALAGLHPRRGVALPQLQRNSHVQSVQPALVVALDRNGHPGGLVLGHVQRRSLALVQRLAQLELTDVPVRRCSMGAMLLLAWTTGAHGQASSGANVHAASAHQLVRFRACGMLRGELAPSGVVRHIHALSVSSALLVVPGIGTSSSGAMLSGGSWSDS